jgi:hypothetical protein
MFPFRPFRLGSCILPPEDERGYLYLHIKAMKRKKYKGSYVQRAKEMLKPLP